MPREGKAHGTIPAPWDAFLHDVDGALNSSVEVHCLGAFVLGVLWGLPRPTADVDFIAIRPPCSVEALLAVAGPESEIAKRRGLYFQFITIAEYPADYATRLMPLAPGELDRLVLMVLEVHDIVLAKLARNSPKDRADVEFLAQKGLLSEVTLRSRFEEEMRPHSLNPERLAVTLELWLEEFFGDGVR